MEAENAALRPQVTVLADRVHKLEARLAKDSSNSGRPPSTAAWACKTRSLRRRRGKKRDGLKHREGRRSGGRAHEADEWERPSRLSEQRGGDLAAGRYRDRAEVVGTAACEVIGTAAGFWMARGGHDEWPLVRCPSLHNMSRQ